MREQPESSLPKALGDLLESALIRARERSVASRPVQM